MSDFSIYNKPQNSAVTPDSVKAQRVFEYMQKHNVSMADAKKALGYDISMPQYQEIFVGQNNAQKDPFGNDLSRSSTENNLVQSVPLTAEEAKTVCVSSFSNNIELAQRLMSETLGNQGIIKKGANIYEEITLGNYAKSKVERALSYEKTCAYILALAKEGEITQKEYVEIKLALAINFLYDALQSEKFSHQSKDIINAFLPYGINLAKDSESDVLDATKVIPLLLEELKNCSMDELNEFTDTIMSLSDEQYENVMPAQIEQMLESQLQRLGIQSTNPTEANFSNINLPKYGVDSIGAIINSSSVEPMKFEEVFRRERGVVYNQQSIEEYAKKESYNNLLVAVNNKCVQIHSLLDTISTNVENTPATRTNYEQNTVLKSFEFDILKSLEILYNGDQSKILEALKKYSGIEDISIDENAISANSSDMTLIKPAIIFNSNNISWKDLLLTISKNLRNDIDQNFACLLGDKTMEDYSNETKQAWKQAYGEKNINTLVEGFQQTQEESLQSVKTGVTTVGILTMVGGMIIPVSPMVAMGMSYGGMAMSTLGTVGVTASEIYSKENGPSDEEIRAMMDELGTSLQMAAAGMAAGKIAEKAFVSAVLSGCPKVAAFIGEVGIDAGISMLADLCITGEIDLTMEGISQLQAFLAGLLRVRGNFNKFLDTHAGTINIPESSTQLKNNDTPKVKSAGEIEGLTTSHLPAQNIDNRDFPVVPEYQFAPSSNPKGYDFESALAAKDVSGNPRFTDGQIQDIRQWHKQNPELVELIITDYDKVAKNFSYTNYFLEYLFNQNFVLDNPDVIIKLLKIKTDDNTCRFTRKDLKNLALAFEILEPETVQKMTEWLKLKQPDGSFLFDVDNVISLAYKIDFVDNMLKQKNPDGSYRYNGNDIFHISRLQGQDDYIDNLIAQNDVEGFPRFSGEELRDLSHNLSRVEVRDCIDTKNPDGSYKYNVYMIKELTNLQLYSIAQRADFEKIFDNIIQYCLDNNINYSKMSKSDVTGQYEITTRDNKVYVFDASGNFVKTSTSVKSPTISSDDVVSKNGSSSFTARFPQNNIKDITSSVKVEKDKNGNLLYKEYYVPSKDVDGKYEIWRKDATGHKYKIGLAEQTPAGEIIVEKTLTAKDGTTTSYTYIEDPKGQRLNFTQIKDKNGNIILENKQQFKVIDENHFQSIENGITYDIKYYDDKVVVTKDDGMQVELSIGENDFRASTGVLSKDLLPVIKQLPGSVLVDIKKYGLAKIGKNLGFADKNNACFANDTLIDVSNELSGNLFVLLHELGHYRDSNKKLSDNQELLDIYEQERQALFNTSSSIEANAMEYFVSFVHYNPKGAVNELVAETNALLYGNNTWKDIELRGQYLQQYFPKTFAKIVQLIQAEDSGMSNIAKTNNSNSTRVQSVVESTNSPTASNIVPAKPQTNVYAEHKPDWNSIDANAFERFNQYEKQNLRELFETSPELAKQLIEEKLPNGRYRFVNIQNILVDIKKHGCTDDLLSLINLKNPDGSYRLTYYILNDISLYAKGDMKYVKTLFDMQEPDNTYRYTEFDIKNILKIKTFTYTPAAQKLVNDLTEQNINGFKRFTGNEIAQIVEKFKMNKKLQPQILKLIMEKNPNGEFKYPGFMISDMIDKMDPTKSTSSIARFFGKEDTNLKNATSIYENVVNYCESNGIDYTKLKPALDKEKGTYELEFDGQTYYFDADGMFAFTSVKNFDNNSIVNYEKTTNEGVSEFNAKYEPLSTYPTHIYKLISSVRVEKDKNGNLLSKEYYVPSKDVEGKYEIWRKDATGYKYKIGVVEKTSAGEIVIEKTLTAKNGTTTSYTYVEDPKGQRLTSTQIKDKDGNIIFTNKQQYKIIDENHFQTIENGVTYDMRYDGDKLVVTKDNGEQVEFTISNDDNIQRYGFDSSGFIPEELFPVVKHLPGSILFDMKKYNCILMVEKVRTRSVAISPNIIRIYVGKEGYKSLFVVAHELGHYRDYNKRICDNEELIEIYKQERAELKKYASDFEYEAMDYLTEDVLKDSSGNAPPREMNGLKEMIAETNALLYSNNSWEFIELRGQYLQQYFPKTFAKIAELLQE